MLFEVVERGEGGGRLRWEELGRSLIEREWESMDRRDSWLWRMRRKMMLMMMMTMMMMRRRDKV